MNRAVPVTSAMSNQAFAALILSATLGAQETPAQPATPQPVAPVVAPEPKLEFVPTSLTKLFPKPEGTKNDSVQAMKDVLARNQELLPKAEVKGDDPDYLKFKAAVQAVPNDGAFQLAIKFLTLAEAGGGNPAFLSVTSDAAIPDPKLREQAMLRFFSHLSVNPFISDLWRASCRAQTVGAVPSDLVPSPWARSAILPSHLQLGAARRFEEAVGAYRHFASDAAMGTTVSNQALAYRSRVAELMAAGKFAALQCDGQLAAQRIIASSVLLGVMATTPQFLADGYQDNCRILSAAAQLVTAGIYTEEAYRDAAAKPDSIAAKVVKQLTELDNELQVLITAVRSQLEGLPGLTRDEVADKGMIVKVWLDSAATRIEQCAALLLVSSISNGDYDAATMGSSELALFGAPPLSADPMKRKETLLRRIGVTSKGLGNLGSLNTSQKAKPAVALIAVSSQSVTERPNLFASLVSGEGPTESKLASLTIFAQNVRRILAPEYLTLLSDQEIAVVADSITKQQVAFAQLSTMVIAQLANRQLDVVKGVFRKLLTPGLTGAINEPGLAVFDHVLATTAPTGADGKATGPAPLTANFNGIFQPGTELNESILEIEALKVAAFKIMQELPIGSRAYQDLRKSILSPGPGFGFLSLNEVYGLVRLVTEQPEQALLIVNQIIQELEVRIGAVNNQAVRLAGAPEDCAQVPLLDELKAMVDGMTTTKK